MKCYNHPLMLVSDKKKNITNIRSNIIPQIGIGERYYSTLDSGMRVIFNPIKSTELVSIYLRVGAGTNYEAEYMGSGISHFVEHAVFLGSKKFPQKDSFSQYVENFGAIDLNAYTTYDHTAYFFSVFPKYLNKALAALGDFITFPNFIDEAVNEEKGTILSEMDMYQDNSSDWFYHYIQHALFPKQPYKFPVIGIREIFKGITAKDLKIYHKKHYKPSNFVLSLVGNFDRYIITKKIETSFQSQVKDNLKKTNPIYYPKFIKNSILKQDNILQTTHSRVDFPMFTLVWSTIGLECKNHQDRFGLELLSYLLASNNGSLLYNELKEKLNLVERVSAYSSIYREMGFFYITFTLGKKYNNDLSQLKKIVKKIEKHLYEIFDEIKDQINEKLLSGAKNTFLKYFIEEQENYMDQAISLTESLIDFNDLNQDQIFINQIHRLTLEDIFSLINKYFIDKKNNKIEKKFKQQFYLLPKKLFNLGKVKSRALSFKDYNSILRKDINKKNFQIIQPISLESKRNYNLILGNEIKLKKKTKRHFYNSYKKKYTLLCHKSSHFPKTYLVLRFNGGLVYESINKKNNINILPGSFNLLSQMLFTSNQKFDKKELHEILKEKAIGYQSFSEETSIGIAFSFLNTKFDSVFDVVSSILFNNRYNNDDLNREKKDIIFQLEKSKENLDYLSENYFKSAFFKGNRLALPIEGDKSINNIANNDLITLKNFFFNNPVVSLYGNFCENSKKKLLELINENHKQNLLVEKKSVMKQLKLDELDFYKTKIIKKYEKNINQSIFQMAYRVPKIGNNDIVGLKVLNSYLSGLGGPLFRLRSESFNKNGINLGGRVYKLGSYCNVSSQYGIFGFYVNFRSEANMEYKWALDSFVNLLNSLKKKSISIIELNRAINKLLAKNIISMMKMFNKAKQESYYEHIGLGYRAINNYQKKLTKISPEEIKIIVRKYFGDNNFLAQVVLPKK